MILKNLRIFSQNVWKNKSFINIILENNRNYNILFFSETTLVGHLSTPKFFIWERERSYRSFISSILDHIYKIISH